MAVVEPRVPSECVESTKCSIPADILPKTSFPSHSKVLTSLKREMTGDEVFEMHAIEETHETSCTNSVGPTGDKDDHSDAPA